MLGFFFMLETGETKLGKNKIGKYDQVGKDF